MHKTFPLLKGLKDAIKKGYSSIALFKKKKTTTTPPNQQQYVSQ